MKEPNFVRTSEREPLSESVKEHREKTKKLP